MVNYVLEVGDKEQVLTIKTSDKEAGGVFFTPNIYIGCVIDR